MSLVLINLNMRLNSLSLKYARAFFQENGVELFHEFLLELAEINDLLCCSVCEEILINRKVIATKSCIHFACEGCKWKERQLGKKCSNCEDWDGFGEQTLLTKIIEMYQTLCLQMKNSLHFNIFWEELLRTVDGFDAEKYIKLLDTAVVALQIPKLRSPFDYSLGNNCLKKSEPQNKNENLCVQSPSSDPSNVDSTLSLKRKREVLNVSTQKPKKVATGSLNDQNENIEQSQAEHELLPPPSTTVELQFITIKMPEVTVDDQENILTPHELSIWDFDSNKSEPLKAFPYLLSSSSFPPTGTDDVSHIFALSPANVCSFLSTGEQILLSRLRGIIRKDNRSGQLSVLSREEAIEVVINTWGNSDPPRSDLQLYSSVAKDNQPSTSKAKDDQPSTSTKDDTPACTSTMKATIEDVSSSAATFPFRVPEYIVDVPVPGIFRRNSEYEFPNPNFKVSRQMLDGSRTTLCSPEMSAFFMPSKDAPHVGVVHQLQMNGGEERNEGHNEPRAENEN